MNDNSVMSVKVSPMGKGDEYFGSIVEEEQHAH